MRLSYFILISLLFPAFTFAQNDRVSEKEVQEEAAFLSALQLRLLDKNVEATQAFLELEKKDGKNDVILFELAKLYKNQNDQGSARKYAEKSLSVNPDNQEYREFLIDIYGSEKDYTALNEHLEYFIKSGVYDESYYFRLARSYRQMGSFRDAIDILERLEKKTGYKKEIGKAKALVYQQQRNKRRLIKELDKLEKSFPDDTDILLQKATMLQSQGEQEKAMDTYRKILKIDPNHRAANLNLTRWMKHSFTKEDFLVSLEPIFRNEEIPMDDKIKQLIPFVAELSGESQMILKMLNLLEILQELYPSNAKVNALHGDIYFNSDQLSKAVAYYEKSIEQNKSVFPVWKNLMLAQDHNFEMPGLHRTASKALDYYPNQAVCYYYIAKADVELGRNDEGLDWLQEGMMLTANNNKLRAEFNLLSAFAYLQKDDLLNARKFLEKTGSSILGNHHSFLFEVKGDLFAMEGKNEQAVANWRRSMQLGGRQQRLQQKIDNIQ